MRRGDWKLIVKEENGINVLSFNPNTNTTIMTARESAMDRDKTASMVETSANGTFASSERTTS